ncbi:MAG: CsbD family protein [Actinomycetota bacterium]|nr:CsbD family protein [Actinomycetota bacterium]
MNDTPRNTDDAKGRVKEAAGNLTGDDDLEREGKVDQAAGTVKDVADSAKDKAEDAIDGVRDRVNR